MAFNATRTAEFFEKEILRFPTGGELARNVVLDASNLGSGAVRDDGRIVVPSGTLLVVSGSDTDEVQSIETTGVPTGGTFKLRWNDEVTTDLDFDASAAEVEAALEALTNLETADVGFAGGALPTAITVTFTGKYSGADVSQIEVAENALTGGTDPQVVVETTTQGSATLVKPGAASGVATADIVGFLQQTVEFFGTDDAKFNEPASAFFHNCIFHEEKLINYSGNVTNVKAALPTCKFMS